MDNKTIGYHTPEKTEEYLDRLNKETNIKWEDSSYSNDMADSTWNEERAICVYFPNLFENFSWFTVQHYNTMREVNLKTIEEVIIHLNKL